MKSEDEIRREIGIRKMAIEDSDKRKASNPNDPDYHKAQDRKQKVWRAEIAAFEWVLAD